MSWDVLIPDDRVFVEVLGDPSASFEARMDAAGIEVPGYGHVALVGLTPAEAEARLRGVDRGEGPLVVRVEILPRPEPQPHGLDLVDGPTWSSGPSHPWPTYTLDDSAAVYGSVAAGARVTRKQMEAMVKFYIDGGTIKPSEAPKLDEGIFWTTEYLPK